MSASCICSIRVNRWNATVFSQTLGLADTNHHIKLDGSLCLQAGQRFAFLLCHSEDIHECELRHKIKQKSVPIPDVTELLWDDRDLPVNSGIPRPACRCCHTQQVESHHVAMQQDHIKLTLIYLSDWSCSLEPRDHSTWAHLKTRHRNRTINVHNISVYLTQLKRIRNSWLNIKFACSRENLKQFQCFPHVDSGESNNAENLTHTNTV